MSELVGLGFTVSDARTGARLVANVVVRGGDDLNFTAGTLAEPMDQGYVFCNVGRGRGTIEISKAGYQTRLIEREFPGETNVDYALEPVAAAWPTRAQVLSVKASFCSHEDDYGNVVFDPGWIGLHLQGGHEVAQNWLDIKHRMGVTHMVAAPVLRYPDYKVNGQSVDYDIQNNPEAFCDFVVELLNDGVVPVVYLTNGDPDDQARVYDGRFRAMCQALKPVAAYCVFLSGWENFGLDPAWETKTLCDALQIMVEELSVEGVPPVIAMHVNSEKPGRCTWASHPVQPNDPTDGNEQGAHYMAYGQYVSLYFYQTCYDGESPVFNLPAWYGAQYDGPENPWNRWAECLVRFVPTGTYIPAWDVTVPPSVPYWFAAPRPAGPEQMVLWEPGVPYPYIRRQCSNEQVRAVSRFAEACRVLQGCYVP